MLAGSYDYFASQAIVIQSISYYVPRSYIPYVINNNEVPITMEMKESYSFMKNT